MPLGPLGLEPVAILPSGSPVLKKKVPPIAEKANVAATTAANQQRECGPANDLRLKLLSLVSQAATQAATQFGNRVIDWFGIGFFHWLFSPRLVSEIQSKALALWKMKPRSPLFIFELDRFQPAIPP